MLATTSYKQPLRWLVPKQPWRHSKLVACTVAVLLGLRESLVQHSKASSRRSSRSSRQCLPQVQRLSSLCRKRQIQCNSSSLSSNGSSNHISSSRTLSLTALQPPLWRAQTD
jgi:hypothetical protein